MPFLTGIKSLTSGLDPRRKRRLSTQAQKNPYNARSQNSQNEKISIDNRPSLILVMLPRVHPQRHFALSDQGWTTINMDPSPNDTLYTSYQALLKSSKTFFSFPQSEKEAFKTGLGSEDGWCRVEGEKEFITLGSLESTPEILRDAAMKYWAEAGGLLNEILGKIEESLELAGGSLTCYSEPCLRLGGKTATKLRLFRYEGFGGKQSKTVAEAHRDLGLLSLVIGDTPGLEVHNRHLNINFPIEKTYTSPSQTLLVGRQLERLTNTRYRAGGHLVRSYPNLNSNSKANTVNKPNRSESRQYRYSIVFVLRAHYPVPIDTDKLTSRITGPFVEPMRGISAGDLYRKIHTMHYNINTDVEEREEQKRRLDEEKRRGSSQGVLRVHEELR